MIGDISPYPVTAAGNGGYVNFLFGHHGSIIDPSCSSLPTGAGNPANCIATTVEMQRQTVLFAFSDGAAISIQNTSVVQP